MREIVENAVFPLIVVTGGTCESIFAHPVEWLALFTVTAITILVVAKWNS